MGGKSALGARLTYWRKPGKVIGVMKNFNFQPLDTKIDPLVLVLDPGDRDSQGVRGPGVGNCHYVIKRVYPVCPGCQHHCLACCLLGFEQMAGKFCLPYRYKHIDFYPVRLPGLYHRIVDHRLQIHQSSQSRSCTGIEV